MMTAAELQQALDGQREIEDIRALDRVLADVHTLVVCTMLHGLVVVTAFGPGGKSERIQRADESRGDVVYAAVRSCKTESAV